MITFKKGNIFTTERFVIGHGVNCMGGFGSGIAGQIATHFPIAKVHYLQKFRNEGWKLGDIQPVDCDRKIIANMATQEYFGGDGKVYASYDAIKICVEKILDYCWNYGYNIAIPKIGCGLGGLEWPKVMTIIETIFSNHPEYENIKMEIWSL